MLKNILALEGVQELDKETQKEVTGGLVCACIYFDGLMWVCC
ncbi:hypothetical protein [Kordia jejudonensis]|nr:hypothetical protein [Kordia jejudonensis]